MFRSSRLHDAKSTGSTSSCHFTSHSSRHVTDSTPPTIVSTGSRRENVLDEIRAGAERSQPAVTHNSNYIWRWDQSWEECFADHLLEVNGRGGLPLVEPVLGVLTPGTVRESTVTLHSRIRLSRVNCSALKPGGTVSADCSGSGSGLKF